MKAVILVAGKAKKFYPATENSHQCLLRLDDKTIIEKMLDSLESLKIKQVILVVGHKSELIINKLGRNYKNMKLSYVKNENYETTGTLASLALAKDFVCNEKFLLIDGDVICDYELVHKLLKSDKENVLLVDQKKRIDKGDMIVRIVNDKVLEIKRSTHSLDNKGYAVFIGLSKFSKKISKKLFVLIDELFKKPDNAANLPYEEVLKRLSKEEGINTSFTEGFNWIKVDQIDELKNAKKLFGDLNILKEEGLRLGADHIFKILPSELVFDVKAKLKCTTCDRYDQKHTCPPRIPNIDYEKMMNTYNFGLLVILKMKITKNNFDRIRKESTIKLHKTLLELEKKAFGMNNYYALSFIGGSCKLCNECGPKCKYPKAARVPLESTGVDVVKTVKKQGISLEFPPLGYLHRVGLLLVG